MPAADTGVRGFPGKLAREAHMVDEAKLHQFVSQMMNDLGGAMSIGWSKWEMLRVCIKLYTDIGQ